LGREKQKMKKQIATIKKKMRRRKHKAKRKWTKQVSLVAMLETPIRECSVRILVEPAAILSKMFRRFLHSIEANSVIVPQLGHVTFLPNSFQFIILQSPDARQPDHWQYRIITHKGGRKSWKENTKTVTNSTEMNQSWEANSGWAI
jgi:hypothetical protein